MTNEAQGQGYGYGTYGYGPVPPEPDSWLKPMLKRYVSIVARHIWITVTAFVIVTTLGLLRAYRATPIYQATAKILVERQGPRVTKFEDVVQPSVEWWGQEYYKTQTELAESRAVMDVAMEQDDIRELFESDGAPGRKSLAARARETIGALLGIPPNTPPEPWELLRGSVSASHQNDTHFILISSESADPPRAAKLANAVARAFVRYHLVRRMEISNDVFLFLQEQKQKEELALQQAEGKLQEFREKTNISSLDADDQDNPVLRRLVVLNEQLTQKQLQRIELEAQVRVIREALGAEGRNISADNEQLFSVPAMKNDDAATEIRKALVTIESERASLADVYGPEHPRMQAVLSKISLLQSKLRDTLNSVAGSLNTQLSILGQEEKELARQYEDQNTLALSLAKDSLAFGRLESEVERHRKLYQVLVERMSEVELSSDYTKTNVELVEEAGVPKAPVRPNKMRMAMTAMIFGLFLGIGLALGIEHLDDTVRTPEDVEIRVGIPVLGFVPQIQVPEEVESKTAHRALITTLAPTSSAIEAYRNIRTNLYFSVPAEESRVLLITSSGPSDGKTTTACNLALVMAQSGKRVLLVDADFRRPRVHKVFGLNPGLGFCSVLQGWCTLEQAVQKTVQDVEMIENLDILTAGPTPANPTELLESEKLREIVAAMKAGYDRVIIDTPPVLFVSDTSILGTVSDGVILVIRSDKCTRAQATRARMQLEKVNCRIIGGILNNVQVNRFSHYYSDYFYHGYARYRSDYYSSYYGERPEEKSRKSRKRMEV